LAPFRLLGIVVSQSGDSLHARLRGATSAAFILCANLFSFLDAFRQSLKSTSHFTWSKYQMLLTQCLNPTWKILNAPLLIPVRFFFLPACLAIGKTCTYQSSLFLFFFKPHFVPGVMACLQKSLFALFLDLLGRQLRIRHIYKIPFWRFLLRNSVSVN
jgi:hypothetical protein